MTNDLQHHISILHEAAHVLARAALGWPSAGVEVDGLGGGETHGTGETYPQWDIAKVAMAGPAVEQIFRRTPTDDLIAEWLETIAVGEWEEESGDDVTAAGFFAGTGYAWARGLLAVHMPDVERIAAALDVRGALTPQEVEHLLSSVDFDERSIALASDARIVLDWMKAWDLR